MGDEKRISYYPWRDLKDLQMWHLGTEFSGGHGSAELMAGFIDRRGLCLPKLFHDSKMKGFFYFFFCVASIWIRWKAVVKDQSPLLAWTRPSALGGDSQHFAFPSITTVRVHLGCKVCVLSYIVTLNVGLDTICVKHQQVLDINSWDNGMKQYIIFYSMCWLLSDWTASQHGNQSKF